jgi:hypothetical protein
VKVKDILSDPSKWTQGFFARDKLGQPCEPLDENAVQYCIVGALMRAYGRGQRYAAYARAMKAIAAIYGEAPITIDDWNDAPDRTFDDVRRVLEAADV